ncbi:cytochrome P450 [Amycolatopsis sp. EV170708-02-1]|nr:cytochrome P450 [Amycolatopsis sp. EV170708-02-1]UMP03341.1 cytochrome P450 [Amycolatopsis sp. EV170708-02-1]
MTEAMPLHMRRNGLNPVAELAKARDGEGVVRVETPFGLPAYLVSRKEDVREVLADPARFSSALTPVPGDAPTAGQLIRLDPPDHTRLRRLLTPEFTVRRMGRLEPRITEIVQATLDNLERAGRNADLVTHFALPVPSLVICELLGVPYADRGEFHQRAVRILDTSLPMDQRVAAQREDHDYMAGLVARARANPGEDLLGMLVREHGDELGSDELTGIAGLLLLAGHDTTANMLGLGTLALLWHPDQLAMLREDPGLIEPAVEELLRWLSVVQSLPPRTTTTDMEIGGHRIPGGSLVICSLPAANRDPALIDDPETFDITRGTTGHVAFGHGPHHCLGAPLARMELRIALPALLRRFPGLALASPEEPMDFRVFSLVYGVRALRVTW